jgi:hypothetical protein
MKIVFQINGGIGKSIAATAVCSAIKRQVPDCELIVITGYPEVFSGNRKVKTVLSHNELNYFYQNHIEGHYDTRFFLQDPYTETDFIHRRGHLIKVWCEMNDIVYNGELPELFVNHKEKTSFGKLFESPKPILLIQTLGGMPNQTDKYSWPRDLPMATAQKIVDHYAATYNVVQIRRKDQPTLHNVFPVEAGFRQLLVLILMSEKRLLIDSFAQHAAAALGLPSVVCWIANVPSQFGYEMHTNLIANQPTLEPELRNSVLLKYNTNGVETEFPYNNEEEIFDAEVIIKAVGPVIAATNGHDTSTVKKPMPLPKKSVPITTNGKAGKKKGKK